MENSNKNKKLSPNSGIPLDEAKAFIKSANLTPVFERLVRIHKWSKKDALSAIEQYQNFLYLKKKYGAQYDLPPSYEIDEVWHAHILHTNDYCHFCNTLYGRFLHHHPHISHATSYEKLNNLFQQTQKLYRDEFGDYIYAIKKVSPIRKLYQGLSGKLSTPESVI